MQYNNINFNFRKQKQFLICPERFDTIKKIADRGKGDCKRMSHSVTSRQLLDLCSKIFEKAGLKPEDALSVASLLVDAERRGINAVVGNNPFGIGLNGEKNKETAIDQACSIPPRAGPS